jgi:excisionase family DNA binding protein
MMNNMVTAKEIGAYLKLTQSTIYKLAMQGEIPALRIGKSWRFDMEEVLRAVYAQKGSIDKEDKR